MWAVSLNAIDLMSYTNISYERRRFLRLSASALGLCATVRWTSAEEQFKASGVIPGKDDRLVVLETEAAVLETPPELLDAQITPNELLFVRNNSQPEGAATLEPWPLKDWKIDFSGLLNEPKVLDAAELRAMEQIEHEMVLQCSGNGRSIFSETAQTAGTQWTRGGMGNVRFSGVSLSAVLKKLQIDLDPSARFISVEGKDAPLPGNEDFEHSIPLDDALSRSILALDLNGRPIPAIHGGPVRLITPGYFGTMQMKWVSRIRFEAAETGNYNHIPRYRTPLEPIKPGSKFDYTLINSKPNWNMKVKTVVTSHTPGSRVPAGKAFTLRGVAFNDGQARIETVLISQDQGETWQRVPIERPKSSYAWYRWQVRLTLKPGKHEVWTRAVDRLGRSQPLDGSIDWNPRGYEWNGVERIGLVAS